MPSLLTAKQVQELLSIDRTTIYRMLKDGRLTGIKVGNQWRFPAGEIDLLLSGEKVSAPEISADDFFEALPLHCMQPMQDVFAEIAGVGSVITDMGGLPLTRISHSCDFCKLVLGSTEGRKACFQSWKGMAKLSGHDLNFVRCHAGLRYASGQIKADDEVVASLVAGQFYEAKPNPEEERVRVRGIAEKYEISPDLLEHAAQDIPICDSARQERLGSWLQRIADTFSEISGERADLMARLKRISEVSVID